jgi:hypothetical protein
MPVQFLRVGFTLTGRVMLTVVILFGVAYVLMIAAVCATLKRARLALEQDYPLTEPPHGTDRKTR